MGSSKNIPQHIALIMDGNGRWARMRGLPRIAGHKAGVKSVQEMVKTACELGVKVLTLYTFSTENWNRPKDEVNALFALLEEHLRKECDSLNEKNIRLRITGDIEALPDGVKTGMKNTMERTSKNDGLILNLALNYGSRAEIVMAVKNISRDVLEKKISPDDIDENLFSGYLYTAGLPDPDLLIRTSGEFRISNFLLWQISYSEIYVTRKLWPDFRKNDLKKAISEYQKRERRFGR